MSRKVLVVLLALSLVFGLVLTSCDDGSSDDGVKTNWVTCEYCGDQYDANAAAAHECFCAKCEEDWDDCDCDYYYRLATLVQNGSGSTPTVPGSETEMGKGFIIGNDFTKIKNAKYGSVIEITLSGTANLDWGSIGAFGIQSMEGNPRVEFKPAVGGTYTVVIPVEDVFRLDGCAASTFFNVNVWGDHVIDKVLYGAPKIDVGNLTPQAKDYVITGEIQQYLDEEVTAFTVVPRYRMSQGAVAVNYTGIEGTDYEKSATLPDIAGKFKVTFDVTAATGWNAAADLVAAPTLTILATKPSGFSSPLTLVRGANSGQVEFSLSSSVFAAFQQADYIVLAGTDGANAGYFGGVGFIYQGDTPSWGQEAVEGNINHTATDKFFVLLKLNAHKDYTAFIGTNSYRKIVFEYWGKSVNLNEDGTGVWNIKESYFANEAYLEGLGLLPAPAGALSFSSGLGYAFVKNDD